MSDLPRFKFKPGDIIQVNEDKLSLYKRLVCEAKTLPGEKLVILSTSSFKNAINGTKHYYQVCYKGEIYDAMYEWVDNSFMCGIEKVA